MPDTLEAPIDIKDLASAAFDVAHTEPTTPEPNPAAPEPAEQKKPDAPEQKAKPGKLVIPDEPETKPAAAEVKDEFDIDKIEPDKSMSKSAQENFKGFKEKAKKEIESLRTRLTEAELKTKTAAPVDDTKHVEALAESQKQIAALQEQLERSDFANSPRFKAQFTDREQGAIDGAKSYLEGTDVDPNVIELAARAKGAAQIKILKDAGIDPDIVSAIMPHLASYASIQRDKAGAIENWKGHKEQWSTAEKQAHEQRQAQTAAEEQRVFAAVTNELSKSFQPLKKIDGQDEWNASVDERNATAAKFFNGEIDMPTLAKAAHYYANFPVVEATLNHRTEQLVEARKEIARLKAAQPNAGSTHTNGNEAPKKPADLKDLAAAALENAMARQ